jgi:Ribbon-helix-helix protein
VTLEIRTARLTILIDPRKKAVFERLCAEEDVTPSQAVRRLIRTYIEGKLGRPWRPEDEPPPPSGDRSVGAAHGRKTTGARRASNPKSGGQRRRAAHASQALRDESRAPIVR